MSPSLLAVLLAQSLTAASSLLDPAPAVAQLAPAVPTAAAQLVQVAQVAAIPGATIPASGLAGMLWLLAIPAVLAVCALLLRRRPESERLLKIIETQSLGGRRALILAQLGNEALLLASSEAGVTLLAARPAPQPKAAPAPQSIGARERQAPAPERPWFGRALLKRLIPAREPTPAVVKSNTGPSSFAALLEETADDQELRRKLVAGRRGRVA